MKHLGFRIKTYLEYRKKAVNQYGLHSPFLYELYIKCFRPRFTHDFPVLCSLRKKLQKDRRRVTITDFGAGSHVNPNSERKVSEMYNSASVSKKQGELLHRLSQFFEPSHVLELGTHLGVSSAYLHHDGVVKFKSLEGCPETAKIASENHELLGLGAIEIVKGEFKKTLSGVLNELKTVDLAYIDGNHSFEGTMWNFEHILPYTHEKSVLIFDDINWSPEMMNAWKKIISNSAVTLSVNCHKFGVLFFKEGVEKQDFYFTY